MKKVLSMLMTLCLLCVMTTPVFAQHYTGKSGWQVVFTQNEKMDSNFKTADMDDAIAGMQPGDDITFTVTVKNQHSDTTDWYMTNKVLQSMEDASKQAEGGGYTYKLTYKSASGTEAVLFDSDKVGGEDQLAAARGRQGLHEATDALEDFFYLDTLSSGRSGTVTLNVGLDGETQGNDYQDKLAELQMNFAVELEPKGTTTNNVINRTNVVRTGDEMRLMPLYIGMAVTGALFLALAIDGRRRAKREEEGEAEE